jgi:ribose 5-phosphate isomerase A
VHNRTVPTAQDELKIQAAVHAARLVEPGMTVGLGTGSTAIHAVREIARRYAAGQLDGIKTFATSSDIARAAADAGLPLLGPQGPLAIDVTIDGADEVDPQLNLIKGGGGALLHEKIVAQATRREIIVVDESKLSARLGTKHALPVEIFPFECEAQRALLERLGGHPVLRTGARGETFVTEEGNFIYDCRFGPIADPEELAAELDNRAGVAAHGLFLGLTDDLIVAGPGGLRHLRPDAATGKVQEISVP